MGSSPLPSQSNDMFDIIVIGGGIMGSCAAYQSAKRGLKTLLLEQFDFLHTHGSSHGHSRTIRATYPEPWYPPMVSSSALLWEQAQSESSMHVYFPSHHLDIGHENDSSFKTLLSTCRSLPIPHSLHHPLSPDPRFHLPPGWLSILSPLGGILNPSLSLSMFLTLARQNGAILKDNSPVIGITQEELSEKNEDKESCTTPLVVTTLKGKSFRAHKCIVTVGPWARKLLKEVCGVHVPVVPIETTICYWGIKEGFESEYTLERGFPTFAIYGNPYVYGTPSLEYPGLIKISVHGGRECDPDKRCEESELLLEKMKEMAEVVFKGRIEMSGEPVVRQTCMYSLTPDEDFVIDYVGGEFGKNVVVGCGFSGHGFKMAPYVGKMLVDIVLGEEKPEKRFRVDRFVGDSVGNEKGFDHQVGLEEII